MLIRPATPADVPAVLPMVAQICALHEAWDADKYGFLPNPAQRYDRWLRQQANQADSIFLVAEAAPGAILAGFLIATIENEIPIYRVRQYGFIHDLWVEPAYRQQGVARQLVQAAIDRFRQLGVDQIRLDTAAANDAARHLFASCGFRVSTIEMLMKL